MTSPTSPRAARCLFTTAALLSLAAPALSADYSPYPKAGVYDASDSRFERVLTVKPNGKFTLEVSEIGKPGQLRSGAGEGRLSDAPGGWSFSEGRCSMTLKRAAGGMQLHVETCASAWGDVPFDGKYQFKGEAAPMPAAKALPAPAAVPSAAPVPVSAPQPSGGALPTRKELRQQWSSLSSDTVAGKSAGFWAQSTAGNAPGNGLERFSRAGFVVDVTSDYDRLPPAEMAKPPLKLVEVPLPAVSAKEGLEFEIDCSFGKSNKVIAINVSSLGKGNQITRKRASAWALDGQWQPQEIKPAHKVKCPQGEY